MLRKLEWTKIKWVKQLSEPWLYKLLLLITSNLWDGKQAGILKLNNKNTYTGRKATAILGSFYSFSRE